MRNALYVLPGSLGLAALLLAGGLTTGSAADKPVPADPGLDWQIPDERMMIPSTEAGPIYFLNRSQSAQDWDKLPAFWNEKNVPASDTKNPGKVVYYKVIVIRVPLGLTQNPPVPPENRVTLAKWRLGKQLYFDPILSSNGTISCATCHDPRKGYTDQERFSTGIGNQKGGMNAPTVINAAFNTFQFWDGRASSLEDQAKGPPQNPVEMFDNEGHAWNKLVARVRSQEKYVQQFQAVFGTPPTTDAILKAIATYERTVLVGNSVHDRAELAMRRRVDKDESGQYTLQARDYEAVLREAFAKKDEAALKALELDSARDKDKISEIAQKIRHGRELFFGKARCNSCHAGDNFTDNSFHNLGVGIKSDLPNLVNLGRTAVLPLGQKNADLIGAFKTPTLRGLLDTAPYMHDGSEATLEEVVDFYDRGGRANEFLDAKMRDYQAEKAYELSRRQKTSYAGPPAKLFGKNEKAIIPLKLNLSPEEKADLVLFMRALQGDPVDPLVADPGKKP
jgi:cytochrome c peroxidase